MPIFEYKCGGCGEVAEILVSSSKRNRGHVCASCGSSDMEKMFSTFAPLVKQRASGGKCDSCSEHKCPYSG